MMEGDFVASGRGTPNAEPESGVDPIDLLMIPMMENTEDSTCRVDHHQTRIQSRKQILKRSAVLQKLELDRLNIETSINRILAEQFTRKKFLRAGRLRPFQYENLLKLTDTKFQIMAKFDLSFKEKIRAQAFNEELEGLNKNLAIIKEKQE